MKTVCEIDKCTGCMACADLCPKNAISIKDTLKQFNAVINTDKCINCNLCYSICQNNGDIKLKKQIEWYQGWANNEEMRSVSSSGGVATALAYSFIAKSGYVYSCTFSDGEFIFKCADSFDDIKSFVGSKYVKSNPKGIYKQIKQQVKSKKDVLFIGLPCQVSALKKVVGENEHLFTVDLICHGSPSPKILEKFLHQYAIDISRINNIAFRNKNNFYISNLPKQISHDTIRDKYTIAFLNGLIYTENCYKCKYACIDRVSDITIGDSWGSELEQSEIDKGISLILVQTNKGSKMLKEADIKLLSVDIKKAIKSNHQLEHPSEIPPQRDAFFDGIYKGKKFNKLILKCYPKQCIKQNIKAILKKIGIY